MHATTFDFLKPTPAQIVALRTMREATEVYVETLTVLTPDGPDKTYVLRKLREVAMWANISITRHPDGTPRT